MSSTAEPGAPEHFSRAGAMMKLGRWPEALAAYDEVLKLEPAHVPSLNNRGIVLQQLGRTAEALASFEQALALDPASILALNNRGDALQMLDRPGEALECFEAALAIRPEFVEANDNRGLLLSRLGRTQEAAEGLRRALELAPDSARLHHRLAEVYRFQAGDPEIGRMRDLAARARQLPIDDRIELGFALGKALADTGDHAGAFEQFRTANALKRGTFAYDEAATLGELSRIEHVFDRAFLHRAEGAGDPGAVPVLIVGMPRSGSTLIEQILASHPKVFGAGEPPDLELIVRATLAGSGGFPEGAAALSAEAIGSIGKSYMQSLARRAPGAGRIVDKSLSNLRFVGLVHAALPNARIIIARRDPMDACVSCYCLLFGGPQPFAYDLGELGRYHRACEQLANHWLDVLPADVVLEVPYERLVADLEGETRRILAHCGLDWDPRCLQFHQTERQVRTSSAAQVREPLYTRSMGAWRRYEPWLGPLVQALGLPDPVTGASPPMESDMTSLEKRAETGDVAAERELAARLDADGRHTEAINWLARAGRAGDAEALTALGLRLLTGRDAPFLPTDGVKLLSDAGRAGGVEALEHLAVLIGGGIYARQSWEGALDVLLEAAERGSTSAQAQLRLLSRGASGSWSSLRKAIDLGAWLSPPRLQPLSQSPRIARVEALAPPEICDWIIGQSKERLVRAELYDPATGKPVLSTETRLNRIATYDLAGASLLNLLVQARMAAAIGAPLVMMEPFAVLHYAAGEEYGEHVDYLDPAIPAYAAELAQRGQRVATCLIYLNDGYEGGETQFPQLGISFKGGKGDALIFFSADPSGRPDTRTVHAGRTPTSGEKWLLSQFFRNRPVVGVAAPRGR